ncbi:MAG: segregation/condensation protein A [Syntrophobacterales bacterium]|nr:segregation/condensation protein A [Syntrophobacterales bacterium]
MSASLTPLEVSVECYEGPLAVLVTLIRKNKVSIWEVPLASITERFLQYVELVAEMNLRIAEDFIEMASLLIFIKSKMLLPVEDRDQENSHEEELVERIIEYEKIKEMSNAIAALPMLNRDLFVRGLKTINREADYDLLELSHMFFELMTNKEERYIEIKEIRPTLEEKMTTLKAMLEASGLYVWSIDGGEGQNEKIATILGMLELTKTKFATLLQRRPFGKVILRKRDYNEHITKGGLHVEG